MKYRFVAEEWETTGELGWLLKDMPSYNPTTGFGVAHDCVEHRPKDKGTIEDELRAIGAVLWTRNYGMYQANGFFRQTPEQWAAGLILDVYDTGVENREDYNPPDLYYPMTPIKKINDEDESILQKAFPKAKQMIRDEWISEADFTYPEDKAYAEERLDQYIEMANVYVRDGFRKVRERYRGWDPWDVYHQLLKPIEEEASRYLNQIEEPGQAELEVTIIAKKLEYKCKFIPNKEHYAYD